MTDKTEQIKEKSKEIISQIKGMTYSQIKELFLFTLKEVEKTAKIS